MHDNAAHYEALILHCIGISTNNLRANVWFSDAKKTHGCTGHLLKKLWGKGAEGTIKILIDDPYYF